HYFLQLSQFLLLLGGIGTTGAINCNRCFCAQDVATGDQNVLCLGIPFTEIKTIFSGNTGFTNINRFDVVPEVGDSIIPANLLGNHRARIINLASCGINPMEIDPDSFKASARTTTEFISYDCDVGKLTWSFLNGFFRLNFLQLEGATKIQSLGSLPSLPSVQRLTITNCQGFTPLTFPGTSLTGLQTLIITENDAELTNEKLDSILTTLVNAKSLQLLTLNNNPSISRIPTALSVLSALHSLDISLCPITTVSSSSLSFSAPAVKALNLEKTSLSIIVENTFNNRYYGNAKVLLDDNKLQDFRSSIYLKILMDMKTATVGESGSLSVTNNPINCGNCQLAWLVRDTRELLPFVNGTCSNGTNFRDLNPRWYDDQSCDTLTTTPLPTTLTSTVASIETTSTAASIEPTSTASSIEPTSTAASIGPTSTASSIGRTSTASSIETTSTAASVEPTSTMTTELPTSVTTQSTIGVQTTKTTSKPTRGTTTLSISSTGSGSTNTSTQAPPVAQSYDTFFYIFYGILGGIGLILVIGFVYLGCILARRRKASARSSDVSSRNSSIAPEFHPVPAPFNDFPHVPETRAVDHRAPYVRMDNPVPPRIASNNFDQHPTGKQYNTATTTIITPYRQPSSARQPQAAAPSGRVRGLKRVGF
ncbi:mucin-5AC-like, partial [Daphnia carinata]|uniref:mucin-5AC-like n=1 Tax=Daphnia carinata TaxID=120202 RepID=UPI002868F9A5